MNNNNKNNGIPQADSAKNVEAAPASGIVKGMEDEIIIALGLSDWIKSRPTLSQPPSQPSSPTMEQTNPSKQSPKSFLKASGSAGKSPGKNSRSPKGLMKQETRQVKLPNGLAQYRPGSLNSASQSTPPSDHGDTRPQKSETLVDSPNGLGPGTLLDLLVSPSRSAAARRLNFAPHGRSKESGSQVCHPYILLHSS